MNFVGSYFPTEKPFKKNTGACNTHTLFKKKMLGLWVTSVQMWRIFPPKDLEKIRRPEYACANLFFENSDISVYVVNKMNFFSLVVLYYHLLLVKSTAFRIFYCLSIYILYSVNHKSFKFNKVFIRLNYLQSQVIN